jgi:hypothetical protein
VQKASSVVVFNKEMWNACQISVKNVMGTLNWGSLGINGIIIIITTTTTNGS